MKILILFLILISFIVSLPSESIEEEIKRRRREHEQPIIDCILRNESSSTELKNRINNNPDQDLIKILSPREYKYDRNDHDIIRFCRRQYLDQLREKQRERREKRDRRDKDKHRSSNDL